ncbi:uncharacterized protein [Nothobranchius furzeri]|uniref:uncharacterized protein isoform X1 n=1 Tax=Nothobranchius furzeri TaxID=105023 RepID=UPI0039048402
MTAFDQSGSNPKTKATLLPPDHAGADSALHQHTYHSLGCCLRSNIFPGISPEWKSLSRDSYVRHPLTTWPADPYQWYGHRTDELGMCHSEFTSSEVISEENLWTINTLAAKYLGLENHRYGWSWQTS